MTINAESAKLIKETFDVSVIDGQKLSRIINTICHKNGISKHPEYNSRFTKMAAKLHPINKEIRRAETREIFNAICECINNIILDDESAFEAFVIGCCIGRAQNMKEGLV